MHVKAVTSAPFVRMQGGSDEGRAARQITVIFKEPKEPTFFFLQKTLITSPLITDKVTSRHLTHDDCQKIFPGGAMVWDMESIEESLWEISPFPRDTGLTRVPSISSRRSFVRKKCCYLEGREEQ